MKIIIKMLKEDKLNKFKSDIYNKYFPFIITAIFLALSILLIWRHELWRDEIQAWLIGSEAQTLSEFISNMRDSQGHPYMWNAILYFISHFITQNPESMKIVHLAISTASVFLILKYAPFNKIIKVMLVFGYFFFYEYSIISRNYALGVLCIVLFCILYKNKYKNILPIAIVLFFMGQANIYSFIISMVLFLMLIIEFIIDRKYVARNVKKIYIILAVLIILGEILFIYWQLGSQVPVGSNIPSVFGKTSDWSNTTIFVSRGIIESYFQIPRFFLNFWDTERLITSFLSNYRLLYTYIVSLVLLIIPIFIIKRKAIFLYIFSLIVILSMPFFIYNIIFTRHYGFIFILFITCIWLSNINKGDKYLINTKGNFNKIFQSTFLIIILISSLIATSAAFYFDWKYPFSNGKYVADYIEENFDKDNIVIVGYQDFVVQTVAGYLNKDIYYPNSKEFRKHVRWDSRFGSEKIDVIFSEADSFTRKKDTVLVIIHGKPVEEKIPKKYYFEKLNTVFNNSIVCRENFFLYLFDKDNFFHKYPYDYICEMNYSNFSDYWKNLDRCEFNIKDEKVWIKVYGEDPHFESNFPIEFKDDKPILMIINIYSVMDEKFQVYYGRKGLGYIEEDSTVFQILEGENNVYIEIPRSENIERIRIDPVLGNTDCYIGKIELYN